LTGRLEELNISTVMSNDSYVTPNELGNMAKVKMEGQYKRRKENDERKGRSGVKGVEEMSWKIFSNKELKR
jgi:hypothetical protein